MSDEPDSYDYLMDLIEERILKMTSRIEKLEAALRRIRDMHDGLVDDLEERDDRTYFIVIGALEGKDD